MKSLALVIFLASLGVTLFGAGGRAAGSHRSKQGSQAAVFLLTQDLLDSITQMITPADSGITGNNFTVRNDGSDKDIKDIYTNKPLGRPVQIGDVFVIRNFLNHDGKRGKLDFVDVMVKREKDYSALGGDFEYFRMDFDSTTDYTLHPNGIVPALDNIYDRGTDVARAACVSCHRNGGQDFLFTKR